MKMFVCGAIIVALFFKAAIVGGIVETPPKEEKETLKSLLKKHAVATTTQAMLEKLSPEERAKFEQIFPFVKHLLENNFIPRDIYVEQEPPELVIMWDYKGAGFTSLQTTFKRETGELTSLTTFVKTIERVQNRLQTKVDMRTVKSTEERWQFLFASKNVLRISALTILAHAPVQILASVLADHKILTDEGFAFRAFVGVQEGHHKFTYTNPTAADLKQVEVVYNQEGKLVALAFFPEGDTLSPAVMESDEPGWDLAFIEGKISPRQLVNLHRLLSAHQKRENALLGEELGNIYSLSAIFSFQGELPLPLNGVFGIQKNWQSQKRFLLYLEEGKIVAVGVITVNLWGDQVLGEQQFPSELQRVFGFAAPNMTAVEKLLPKTEGANPLQNVPTFYQSSAIEKMPVSFIMRDGTIVRVTPERVLLGKVGSSEWIDISSWFRK